MSGFVLNRAVDKEYDRNIPFTGSEHARTLERQERQRVADSRTRINLKYSALLSVSTCIQQKHNKIILSQRRRGGREGEQSGIEGIGRRVCHWTVSPLSSHCTIGYREKRTVFFGRSNKIKNRKKLELCDIFDSSGWDRT